MNHPHHPDQGSGIERELHDPISDKLVPLAPLDLSKIHTVDDLVRAMGRTAFTGRQIGHAADVLEVMARDREAFIIMTLAGAMTVAKQGLIITDLLDAGIVKAIVSTGALMAHGLVEAAGKSHFVWDEKMDDVELYEAGYNRVYDTLEPETNLNFVESIVAQILEAWDAAEPLCSYKFTAAIGKYLSENAPAPAAGAAYPSSASEGRGILRSAYEKGAAVYIPAFTDSEIGLDLALHNRKRAKQGRELIRFDPFLDLNHFAEKNLQQTRLGIFTIGGGVPRNWTQQFGPYIELRHRRGGEDLPLKRYHYGLRICPEPVHWGGLSGSPYSEAISWGKFVPPAEGGQFAEVFSDATVALPLVAGAVLERLKKK